MARYVLTRIALALITLLLLSMMVFALAQLLPGDVGRSVLGPLASQDAVDALNQQLGTDRPAVVQYLDWLRGLMTGDLGNLRSAARDPHFHLEIGTWRPSWPRPG